MGWDSGKSRDNDFISRARKLLSYIQARTGIDEILLFYLKPLLGRKMASGIQSKNLYIRKFILYFLVSLSRWSDGQMLKRTESEEQITLLLLHLYKYCYLPRDNIVLETWPDLSRTCVWFRKKPINFFYTCTNVPYRKLLHRSSRELDGVLFDWLEKSEAKWVGPQCKVSDDIEGVLRFRIQLSLVDDRHLCSCLKQHYDCLLVHCV